jgi:hypothetical protein
LTPHALAAQPRGAVSRADLGDPPRAHLLDHQLDPVLAGGEVDVDVEQVDDHRWHRNCTPLALRAKK